VDLRGMGDANGADRLIAFRADIDALIMDEANE
jgi:metal-dependent amidase/aminoacylase/carboxypeptidase family protein